MTAAIAIVLFFIFVLLSTIHFYWGGGGRWGNQAVYPIKSNHTNAKMPGALPTFIAAIGLLSMGIFILIKKEFLAIPIPFFWLDKYGLWAIAGIFISRSVGDFRYIGFFKKISQTKFAKYDTKYYSPLCLSIGILTIIIAYSSNDIV